MFTNIGHRGMESRSLTVIRPACKQEDESPNPDPMVAPEAELRDIATTAWFLDELDAELHDLAAQFPALMSPQAGRKPLGAESSSCSC